MSGRVFFYVQHLLGIGHLARASRVASALADSGFDVTVVTGGTSVAGFPGPGVRHVELPPIVSAEGFSGLLDIHGQPIDDTFKAQRRDLLIAALREARPDIVVVEAFPFGRRQVRFELLPMLDTIAQIEPRPLLVTSVRDILQERNKPGRDEETVETLNAHFDLVMAHGDPAFARLGDTFPLADRIRPAVGYTGLVAPPATQPSSERYRVVLSAGGGAAGAELVWAGVEAARLVADDARWLLVTGPNLPDEAFRAAAAGAPPALEVARFRKDFAALLAACDLSVSQAGYNTVGDVLRAGCRCVLVPFAAGGETEQTARAERLSAMGLATALPEDGLTGKGLAEAITLSLAGPRPPRAALDLDGAAGSARLLRRALDDVRSGRSA